MNILFINNLPFNPVCGGIERVTDNIVKGLISLGKGYRFYYLFFKVHNKDILRYEFPAHIFECPDENGFDSKENIDYYINILKKYSINVVINQRGGTSLMNNAVKLTKQSKVISVIHSDINYWIFRQKFLHYDLYNKSFISYCKYLLKKLNPYVWGKYVEWNVKSHLKSHYNEIANISDALVVLSKQSIKDLKSYIEDSRIDIYSIPNPNTFIAQDIDFSLKKKEILFVGRLDFIEKAPLLLLKIWRKLYKKHSDWKLILVGEGDARNAIVSYVNKYKIPRVYVEGSKSNVEDYYERASIVCLTSVSEGWGMALTEGMTYGCVPFTFDNSGSSYEIIDNNINGCLISSYNIKEYSKRLSELMSNNQLLFTIGKCALKKSELFSIENVTIQWDLLLEKLSNDTFKV